MIPEKARGLWFVDDRRIELREDPIRRPGPDEIVVRATKSLISAGTEMLLYRGLTSKDDFLPPNSVGQFPFPVKYGYQVVGEVVEAGPESGMRVGDHVFCRHPHQEVFTIKAIGQYIVKVPEGVDDASATFTNLTRVALTANLDVPTKVGETVVVYGQGIVGMMLARMASMNAANIIVADKFPQRLELARKFGLTAVTPEEVPELVEDVTHGRGADVVYECSGSGRALQASIQIAAYYGDIVAVSMYGDLDIPLRLVPEFHFRKLRITSSQGGDQHRWDWIRRTEASVELLERLSVKELISHTFPFREAAKAYELVDTDPTNILGVVLDYEA
jgi:2-desacetyl-2-hydroxyethyl bacteriochlorophyllide A dehydrogenase